MNILLRTKIVTVSRTFDTTNQENNFLITNIKYVHTILIILQGPLTFKELQTKGLSTNQTTTDHFITTHENGVIDLEMHQF